MAESEAEELLRMKADELEKTEELLVTTATELEEKDELPAMKADELEKTEELLVTMATELEEFAETGESSSGETVGELQAQNAPNKIIPQMTFFICPFKTKLLWAKLLLTKTR